jgi:hypothetical protein
LFNNFYNLIIGDYMFNPNKITKILGATFILVSSNSVFAETVSDASATVTVQNAFTLLEAIPLNFGIIRATADDTAAGDVATLTLSTAGVTAGSTVNLAAIAPLSGGTPGSFTVTGAAPFTDLEVTFPSNDATVLVGGALPASAANFTIGLWSALVVGGLNDGDTITTAGTMQTDSAGAVAMTVGATLSTDAAAASITQNYQDVAYTSLYTVIVDY